MIEAVDSIESFVVRLKTDAVEAGKREVERLELEARTEAKQIVAKAQREADELVKTAQKQAADLEARANSELQLAVRDTVLRLQEALGRALTELLQTSTGQAMADDKLLKSLIMEVVQQYTQQDASATSKLTIKVPADKLDKVMTWVRSQFAAGVANAANSLDLQAGLRQAGFEYRLAGGVVEVTAESVAAVLAEMLGPKLRAFLTEAQG